MKNVVLIKVHHSSANVTYPANSNFPHRHSKSFLATRRVSSVNSAAFNTDEALRTDSRIVSPMSASETHRVLKNRRTYIDYDL